MRRTSFICILVISPVVLAAPLGCGLILGLDGYERAEPHSGVDAAGEDGRTPDRCVPAKSETPIEDDCGVFIAPPGNDTDAGTKQHPVATFKVAIERAKATRKPIYACAAEFSEALIVPAGVAIYGGLDCTTDWKYVSGPKTTIKPLPDMVALTVSAGEGMTHIADVTLKASDASIPGGSSIAMIVDGATAEFVRCDFEASSGHDGDSGETPAESLGPADAEAAEVRGNNGVNACFGGATDAPGGDEKANPFCPSVGGKGGAGMVDGGANGEDGQLLPNPNPMNKGAGGIGAGVNECTDGTKGQPGIDGTNGAGAMGLGTLSSTGYAGASGMAGVTGTHGQGGGGGGGAKGKTNCAGASAGGGGAGGCGGKGGKGGSAGGSSIAIISLNAALTFIDVALKSGAGGKGGDGGDGQAGGAGGIGGDGGLAAAGTLEGCLGGRGGTGGFGGKGGGGRGGHSIGIAFTGTAPPGMGATITNGAAGVGGVGFDAPGSGKVGVLSEMQEF